MEATADAANRVGLFRKDATAQGVAKQRLIETIAGEEKRVIHDPYADYFVKGASLVKCLGHSAQIWLLNKMLPGMHEHLIARTRAIDDLVTECAAAGAVQYVILGAGYDMRAYRLTLGSLKVFEVDQLEVQELKKANMPADALASGKVTHVSVDFNTQTLTEQLTKAGFEAGRPTIVTLEGVTQYIPHASTAATIREMGALCGPGSTLFLSYVDERFATAPAELVGRGYPKPEAALRMISGLAAKFGEPWIALYSASQLATTLSSCGFEVTSDTCFEDVNEAYFGAVGRLVPPELTLNLERFAVAKKK